jgi:hypothetical protein
MPKLDNLFKHVDRLVQSQGFKAKSNNQFFFISILKARSERNLHCKGSSFNS